MKRLVYLTFSVVLIAFVSVWVLKNLKPLGAKRSEPSSASSADTALSQKVYSFSMDGRTAKGVKQWHLEGEAAEIVGEDINLDDLSAVAYSDQYTVKISSDNGIFHRNTSEVELMGNVKVATEDNDVILTTDRATWSQTTKEVTTDAAVTIVQKGMKVTGEGARANAFEKKAKFLSKVTVEMEPSTIIKCDGELEVEFDANKAVFHRNVSVVDKDGRIKADKMTVFADPVTHKVAQVIAEGNVEVFKGNSYTVCERATYTDGTRSVQLLGRPKVVIAPEDLEGSNFLEGNPILGNGEHNAVPPAAVKSDTVK